MTDADREVLVRIFLRFARRGREVLRQPATADPDSLQSETQPAEDDMAASQEPGIGV